MKITELLSRYGSPILARIIFTWYHAVYSYKSLSSYVVIRQFVPKKATDLKSFPCEGEILLMDGVLGVTIGLRQPSCVIHMRRNH